MHDLPIVPIAHKYDTHSALAKALQEALEPDVVTGVSKTCRFALSLQFEAESPLSAVGRCLWCEQLVNTLLIKDF